MQVGCDLAMVDHQGGLNQPGDTGGRLGMPDVRLDRSNPQPIVRIPADAQLESQRLGLHRIARLRPGPMRLYISDLACMHASLVQHLPDQRALRGGIGRGNSWRVAVLIDTGCCEARVNAIAGREGR